MENHNENNHQDHNNNQSHDDSAMNQAMGASGEKANTCEGGKCADGVCKGDACGKKGGCPCGRSNCDCSAKMQKFGYFALGVIVALLVSAFF